MTAGPFNQFRLLSDKRFVPLFLAQLFSALGDNLFRNAMVATLVVAIPRHTVGWDAATATSLASAAFMLPFLIFAGPAGRLADRSPKSLLAQRVRLAGLAAMVFSATALFFAHPAGLVLALFLLGTQATFFSPVKYALLPELLKRDHLLGANGLTIASTFTTIFLAAIVARPLVESGGGLLLAGLVCLSMSLLAWLAARYIPDQPARAAGLSIDLNLTDQLTGMTRLAWGNHDVFRPVVGIAWFWLLGALFVFVYPNYTAHLTDGREEALALLFGIFCAGAIVGCLTCDALLHGKVRANLAPIGAVGITLFSIHFFYASANLLADETGRFVGTAEMLTTFPAARIAVDIFAIAFSGGLFVAPLYTALQINSKVEERGRMIAVSNALNAIVIGCAAALATAALSAGLGARSVFLAIGLINIAVAVYVSYVVVVAALRAIGRQISRLT